MLPSRWFSVTLSDFDLLAFLSIESIENASFLLRRRRRRYTRKESSDLSNNKSVNECSSFFFYSIGFSYGHKFCKCNCYIYCIRNAKLLPPYASAFYNEVFGVIFIFVSFVEHAPNNKFNIFHTLSLLRSLNDITHVVKVVGN